MCIFLTITFKEGICVNEIWKLFKFNLKIKFITFSRTNYR